MQQERRLQQKRYFAKYHPDRLGGDCSSKAESGVKKFLEVDAAWRVLSDQTTRTQYDLQRRAWTLKQDWPIDSTVYVDDMTWDDDQGLYTHSCRCGGVFSVTEEELEEEPQRKQQDEGEKETEEGQHKGAIVCCDTCSLSVYVTWSTDEKAQKSGVSNMRPGIQNRPSKDFNLEHWIALENVKGGMDFEF
ncbi:dnaJ homolog subfamily C member 24 isoform X3 [Pundamilia nyererei]|uniref:DnaJ homolog subfamily C member 24 isoform X3 n=1 Tax=Pundamilia nyererei TaxID=303518 RepID=A0A9Y3RW90_9CICH|nr:PREDICTED: dnaJ homolog subfamily C member 24 isoform X3 [Pundamilia nyererei]